ncbi:DUF6493 family protein [Streptomyces sp. NBC_00047]|uniref:DUF7824 domain-containing protein n=1 Tax=Streptomyces sp. NBC_00047 TaxID=2975627 RepID=UPI002253ACF1|nr:DUF6493 family protein [Streptomyces sp. NBC_00047]MCX5612680.1 DUF6493 family protein [Streptomyces sp. NBC_00047]
MNATAQDTSAPAAQTDLPAREILAAVRAGRAADLPGLLKPLDRAQRRELLAELKVLRADLRSQGWENWRERDLANPALVVAGAGCTTGAAAAASWIAARDLRRWQALPTGVLLDVLSDREPRWLGDLAHRLAARAATAEQDYPLIRVLVGLAGCAMPTTDGCLEGWASSLPTYRTPLVDALRSDPYTAQLVPRLFETAEPVTSLRWLGEPAGPYHWPTALVALAEEGLVDRTALLDGCTARLLRGGTAPHLKPYLAILQALHPTAQEERERVADWIALAADAPSAVAGHAQQALARLAAAGGLAPRLLAEMSLTVLFRPEKKLVRAQLVLLGRELVRDPAAAPELLPVLGEAFGHTDTDIQERALKLAAAHLVSDPHVRAGLAESAHLLSPLHRARAVEILGPDAAPATDDAPYREILPPPPAQVPLAPAPESVEETAELVAAVVNSRTASVEEYERALDGLVRHAHRDRAALAAALRPALAGRWWLDPEQSRHYTSELPGIEHVAAAVLGARPAAPVHPPGRALASWRSDCHHPAFHVVAHARVAEAARHIAGRPLPFLLAVPTHTSGSLDPRTLIERLAAYARLGETPAPVDFAQALLRTRRDPTAIPAAAALGTPEGDRLAAWLGEQGLPAAVTRRTAPAVARHYDEWPEHLTLDTGERPTVLRRFPKPFRELGQARMATGRCWDGDGDAALVATLPEDRETLAAWSLPAITSCALHEGRGGSTVLPLLAAAGGPAGPALHLAVATGLGARHAEDRLRAVDAFLALAARGELDAVRLGSDLGEQLTLGTVKPNRLADSLRTAAATGACTTTWSVLAAALPALLAGTADPRGTGDLLEMAADCVEESAAASSHPAGLAAVAARGGRSRLVTQAIRLGKALDRNQELAPA